MTIREAIIAIDGYSSTGKSTFAKAIAARWGLLYLDSGALYRAVTLLAMEKGLTGRGGKVDVEGLRALIESAPNIHFKRVEGGRQNAGLTIGGGKARPGEASSESAGGATHTFVGERDVEARIRSIGVSRHVSPVAAVDFVRAYVDGLLHGMAREGGVVMDGRDIGTTVFPDAQLKIFMTASPQVRAHRRMDEMLRKGESVSFGEVLENLRERDYIDSHREVSPLTQAPDAIVLDNSEMTPGQQMAWMEDLVSRRFSPAGEPTAADSGRAAVEIDPDSGFCFGVVAAIRRAEEELAGRGCVYSLGEIVHNEEELARLSALGLKTVRLEDIETTRPSPLLIRAHGEPPQTYALARTRGLELIDCTCPVVLKLQESIRSAAARLAAGGTIVIFGKKGHPEVLGLQGQVRAAAEDGAEPLAGASQGGTEKAVPGGASAVGGAALPAAGPVLVVEGIPDLEKAFSEGVLQAPVELFSQTTMDPEAYRALAERLGGLLSDLSAQDGDICEPIAAGIASGTEAAAPLTVHRSICRQVERRHKRITDFAVSHDVIIFVAGKSSSNGQVLCDECRAANPRTYAVASPRQVKRNWLEGAESIGVCGATSTPGWLLEQVAEEIRKQLKNN